jgi:threonine dehydratase
MALSGWRFSRTSLKLMRSLSPLAASLASGKPVEIDHTSSFEDGIYAPFIFPGMWGLASELLDGSLVVELEQVASAIGLMAERLCIMLKVLGRYR